MMQLTTANIIKVLPFEESFKHELLQELPVLSKGQVFTLDGILRNTFYALYDARLQENMQIALDKVAHNQEKLGEDFYARVQQQTMEELEEAGRDKIDSADLEAARRAMEQIVQEIRAAKANKKISR